MLWAGNHKLPGAEIMLDARRAAAVRPPPVRLKPLGLQPPLPQPAVKEYLYVLVRRKMFSQGKAKIGLVSGHDDQTSHSASRRRCFW